MTHCIFISIVNMPCEHAQLKYELTIRYTMQSDTMYIYIFQNKKNPLICILYVCSFCTVNDLYFDFYNVTKGTFSLKI